MNLRYSLFHIIYILHGSVNIECRDMAVGHTVVMSNRSVVEAG